MGILTITKRLGCVQKLTSYLAQVLKTSAISFDDYSKVVASTYSIPVSNDGHCYENIPIEQDLFAIFVGGLALLASFVNGAITRFVLSALDMDMSLAAYRSCWVKGESECIGGIVEQVSISKS